MVRYGSNVGEVYWRTGGEISNALIAHYHLSHGRGARDEGGGDLNHSSGAEDGGGAALGVTRASTGFEGRALTGRVCGGAKVFRRGLQATLETCPVLPVSVRASSVHPSHLSQRKMCPCWSIR